MPCPRAPPPSTSRCSGRRPCGATARGRPPALAAERVQALLLVLLARGGGTQELAGALWPDLDTPGALRNLRVTLSYLLAVLEPDRPDGAPSFFVRAEGPRCDS